jgi:M6 family metalloprotease-like protein
MKFYKKIGILVCSILPALVGCDFSSTPSEQDISSFSQVTTSVTYYDIYNKNGLNNPRLQSTGDAYVIVLPIHISGLASSYYPGSSFESDLEKTFFGESSDTYWESLTSFYNKSSYGQLNIKGVVAPIYNADINYRYVPSSNSDPSGIYGVSALGEKALHYFLNITQGQALDKSSYDQNNDGYADSVWLVYDIPNYSSYNYLTGTTGNLTKNTIPYWAYTSNVPLNNYINDSLHFNNFSWASYDFMYEKKSGLDAHTYIHETGHLLGLDDYYDYNGATTPMGCIDMMDYNVGDHNSFSKFALGWVKPYLIDSAVTLNLKSATETGECIILKPQDYNGTAFSEYFMVQFVTPTGLNYQDYVNGYYIYKNNAGVSQVLTVYSEPGIMITHVTSYFGYSSNNSLIVSTNPQKMKKQWLTNTSDDKENFCSIIQKDYSEANNIYATSYVPTNDALFKAGDTFSLVFGSKYTKQMESGSYFLNDGSSFRYKIKVNNITSTNANISIYIV